MFSSLQFGRAIAAILVTLGHAGAVLALDKYFGIPALGVPFAFGHAGVEFFFVLSGFIITWSHWHDLGNPGKIKSYLFKRFARIYPIYWLIFISVFVVAQFVPSAAASITKDTMLLVRGLTLMPLEAKVVGGTGAPVLVVAWTLQYEIFFYASFCIALFNKTTGKLMCGVFLLVYVTSSLLNVDFSFPFSFIFSHWLLLFLIGSGLAAFARSGARISHPSFMASFSGLAFLAIGACESAGLAFDRYVPQQLSYGICSSGILLGLVGAEQAGLVYGNGKLMQLLGAASYSLYLTHFVIVSAFAKFAIQLGLRGPIQGVLALVVIFLVCVSASVVVHLFVEKPMAMRLRRMASRAN